MATRKKVWPDPERDPDLDEDASTMLDERFSRRRKRDLDEETGDLPDEPPPGWCDY